MSSCSPLLAQLSQSKSIDRHPLIVTPQMRVTEVINWLNERQSSYALVVQQKRLVGIFTERDFVRIAAHQLPLENSRIQSVMTPDPITVSIEQDQGIFSILYLLRQHHIRHLPVINKGGEIIGVITPKTIRDVVKPTDLLKFKQVGDVMTSQVIQNYDTASLLEITQQMLTHKKSCIVITETKNNADVVPQGIITEHDIIKCQKMGIYFATTPAKTVMSRPLFIIKINDSMMLANEIMKRHEIRRLVVIDEAGILAGLITESTILEALNPLEMYATIELMRQQVDERTKELSQVNEQLQQNLCQYAKLEEQLQQAKDEAAAANQVKRAFLANLNHEFRTPLHAILGFSQLMYRSESLSSEDQKNVGIIYSAGKHLLELLENLLDLTKSQSTHIRDTANFELSEMLPKIPESPITITLTPTDLADLPGEWRISLHQATIEGDFDRMLSLIEEIRDRDESLANSLSTLTHEFQFEYLLALTKSPTDEDDDCGVNSSIQRDNTND
ncbi:MAG: CBS domain-containing protein [Coleofasciculus chthonoplastes F3-SA18-01]|uniref:CBS domain-containing protein n=1 Tax=Coleofasciculus chthonoplastes TaxID=64178 RepID=UPI003303B566